MKKIACCPLLQQLKFDHEWTAKLWLLFLSSMLVQPRFGTAMRYGGQRFWFSGYVGIVSLKLCILTKRCNTCRITVFKKIKENLQIQIADGGCTNWNCTCFNIAPSYVHLQKLLDHLDSQCMGDSFFTMMSCCLSFEKLRDTSSVFFMISSALASMYIGVYSMYI